MDTETQCPTCAQCGEAIQAGNIAITGDDGHDYHADCAHPLDITAIRERLRGTRPLLKIKGTTHA